MRVLIVDQFGICRMGMKTILLQVDENCEFIEADTIEEGIAAVGDQIMDLITVDLDVPEVGGFGMLDKITEFGLSNGVILFSTVEDYAVMQKAYKMGISAFIGEQTKKQIIISAFQIVLAGGKYFSPEVIAGKPGRSGQTYKAAFLDTGRDQPILSNRQFEVLRLLSEGKPNKIIARELEIATGTVKVHIAGILKSLKAKNRTQAVSIAQHINILP